jgi:hypothetical protein
MKNKKTKMAALLLLGFALTTVQAQQAFVASGGNASGSGGTVAYSVGQIVYTLNSGANGSAAQGVQQAFEISVTLGLEEAKNISLNLMAYPNPTSNLVTLNVADYELSNLSFELFDLNGRSIERKKITNTTETIRLENLPSATYFLKVTNSNKELKTFKIIKN